MSILCKHIWDKISETTLPSPFETLKEGGCMTEDILPWLMRKTHIVILTCKKCGKVHKEVTAIQ